MKPTDETTWRGILGKALGLLDTLEARGFGRPDIALGGGTALMLRFRHRLSKDIDLFLADAQWLPLLSPRLNDAAGALARDYVEQANTVKLVMPEGDIDFIVAGRVTALEASETLEVAGWRIPFEAPAEIVAKKLLYRSASFKARDVFDLAILATMDPNAARIALDAARPALPTVRRRIAAMADAPPADHGIVPIGSHAAALDTMYATALRAIDATRT